MLDIPQCVNMFNYEIYNIFTQPTTYKILNCWNRDGSVASTGPLWMTFLINHSSVLTEYSPSIMLSMRIDMSLKNVSPSSVSVSARFWYSDRSDVSRGRASGGNEKYN